MANDTVRQVKDRLNIVDVVSGYVKLQKAGASYKARCPFHSEKSPSFMLSPERGTYHCFGCGVGGDIFTFVQEIEGVDFKGALKILAERAGVPVVFSKGEKREDTDPLFEAMEAATRFFESQLVDSHPARTYLKERGLTDATIKNFRIGWAPDDWHTLERALKAEGHSEKTLLAVGLLKEGDKGAYDRFRSRIMFPLFDAAGRTIAFSGRIFAPKGDVPEDVAKYMNSPETALFKKSYVLYGFDRAKQSIRKNNFSVLVEGQMDLVSVHQAGWGNAVAVSGTAFTEQHARLLKRMSENIVLALDADGAGVAAAKKSAALALSEGMDVKVARMQNGLDPADLIQKEGKEAWAAAIRGATHVIDFLLNVLEEEAKDTRSFARAVEKEVLPFIKRIQSPIDREHFIALVAQRIRVTEEAVREGVLKTTVEEVPHKAEPAAQQRVHAPDSKLSTALGIILFQEQVPKPVLDVAEARVQLEKIAGEALKALPPHEEEAARFKAEEQYGNTPELRDTFHFILRTLERESLQRQFKDAQERLKEAEGAGDEAGITQALELCTALSKRLAGL